MEAQGEANKGSTITLELTAQRMAFDKHSLSAPCSARVILTLHNQDPGVPHNFSLYESSRRKQNLFYGKAVTGVKEITYEFIAPAQAGKYFFRCDIHPMQKMSGDFLVTESK